MGTVVGSNSNGEYDLARGLALYDSAGDLAQRSRELWSLLEADSFEMAREFWARYARSPELSVPFDLVQIDDHAAKIQPFVAMKFARIEHPEWTAKARIYVERAVNAGLTRGSPRAARSFTIFSISGKPLAVASWAIDVRISASPDHAIDADAKQESSTNTMIFSARMAPAIMT